MDNIDLLISAKWILPIAPDNSVLENHALAIRAGRIVDLLPLKNAQESYYAEQYIELNDHVLMPGLVNAHTHTPMNLFRGLADDLALMDWLKNHMWPAEQAIIDTESVNAGTHLAIAEMLRGGTTCFNDHFFFHDEIAKLAVEAGMRACVGLIIINVPTKWAPDENGYFERAIHTLEKNKKNSLISWSMAPHAPYTVSDKSLKKVKELSDHYQLPIHMHMHETAAEIEQSMKEYGMRPLDRLNKLGLLSSRFIHVHATQLTNNEIKLIRDTNSHIVHCPESNLKLASGFSPIGKLLDAGVNVAIGTDSAASNNDLDLFGEAKTAALIAKAVSANPTVLPAEEALAMITINGAKAIGLEKEIGSLEAGKAADIIAIDLSSYLTQPIYNPISHLIYALNRLQVSDVWVAGKQLLKQGKFTHLELEALLHKAQYWSQKAAPFKANVNVKKSEQV